jgi:spore coat polysaccharide biosynthesis predicted glycosyltransferase SpsG
VASIHDRGVAPLASDLAIDGSICPGAVPAARVLSGPTYALLDPSIAARRPHARIKRRVLVTLGGGPRAELARQIATQVLAQEPDAEIRLASGWTTRPDLRSLPARAAWLPSSSLHDELRNCEVAVVAGGMTLYEAAAVGTPAVALSVVPAQRPAVRAFSRVGVTLDGGLARTTPAAVQRSARRVAGLVTQLLDEAPLRGRLSSKGRRLVDGRGAIRVASALVALANRTRRSR